MKRVGDYVVADRVRDRVRVHLWSRICNNDEVSDASSIDAVDRIRYHINDRIRARVADRIWNRIRAARLPILLRVEPHVRARIWHTIIRLNRAFRTQPHPNKETVR